MIPTLQVVKIQTTQILAGSPGLTGTYGSGQILSREAGVTDDDNWEE